MLFQLIYKFKCQKRQSSPYTRKVLYVDLLVRVGLPLAPEQQRVLRRLLLAALVLLVDVDLDLLDLEPQDDGPDEAQDEPGVAVDDVLGADALQPDLQALKHQDLEFALASRKAIGKRAPCVCVCVCG